MSACRHLHARARFCAGEEGWQAHGERRLVRRKRPLLRLELLDLALQRSDLLLYANDLGAACVTLVLLELGLAAEVAKSVRDVTLHPVRLVKISAHLCTHSAEGKACSSTARYARVWV